MLSELVKTQSEISKLTQYIKHFKKVDLFLSGMAFRDNKLIGYKISINKEATSIAMRLSILKDNLHPKYYECCDSNCLKCPNFSKCR
jgi:hypothetical protein